MIPLKLSVRNFLCYREDVPTLDLQGIHVACLCGPNGHGKSALLDALTWCLWGQARTGSRNHDALIAHGETECRVELDFEAQGQAHRAIRRRRRTGQGRTEVDLFVLDDGGEPRPITGNTVRETNARIRRLVGMDYDTFVNTAFLLQGRSDEFTRKNPTDRKEVLSSILGLDLYELLQSSARGQRSQWQDTVARTDGALHQTQASLDAIPDPSEPLSEIADRLANLESTISDATAKVERNNAVAEQLRARQREVHTTEQRIENLRADLLQADAAMVVIQQRIGRAQASIQRADDIRYGAKKLETARAELDRLESARREHDRLQAGRARLQTAITNAEASLSAEAGQIERRLSEELGPLIAGLASVEDGLANVAATESALDSERRSLADREANLAGIAAAIAAGESDLQRCVAEGKELRARQQEMSAAASPDALCPLCRTPLSEDACENLAGWYESEIAAKLQQHRQISATLNELSAQQKEVSGNIANRRQELEKRQRQTQLNRGQLEQQRKQGAQAQEQLETLQPRLEYLRRSLVSGAFAANEQEALAGIDRDIASLQYDDDARDRAYQTAQSLQHWESDLRELDAAMARLPDDEAELASRRGRADRWQEEITEAEASLVEANAALGELPQIEKAVASTTATLSRLAHERDQLLAERGRLQGEAERRKTLAGTLSALKADHENAQTQQGIYAELFAAFGRSGVPAMLIDAAVPQIEQESNRLLGRMTDNRLAVKMETQRVNQGGNVAETLDILISDELGPRSYELFSGGEAFRINLALRIALSKVLSSRLGAPLPTLFIDEGFGTQDAAGRERIVDAIASIQDEFDKIIVITHLDDLKDLFPARIEVLKTQDGSQFWLS